LFSPQKKENGNVQKARGEALNRAKECEQLGSSAFNSPKPSKPQAGLGRRTTTINCRRLLFFQSQKTTSQVPNKPRKKKSG
jgi:hypothetical protein